MHWGQAQQKLLNDNRCVKELSESLSVILQITKIHTYKCTICAIVVYQYGKKKMVCEKTNFAVKTIQILK